MTIYVKVRNNDVNGAIKILKRSNKAKRIQSDLESGKVRKNARVRTNPLANF